jgi:hypothetical protein
MKVEKLDRVVITVADLGKAKEFLSDLLETKFDEFPSTGTEDKAAISPLGIELMESVRSSGIYGVWDFHLKVPNLGEAKKEMIRRGARHLEDIEIGKLKEAIFHLDNLNLRLVLVEYEGPSHGAFIAAQKKGDARL